MRTITFSSMLPLQGLDLNTFEQKTFIHPIHQQFDWMTGWNNILQVALYQKGPDVSEIGSTWLDNLVSMNGLRPFRPAELRALGGEEAFYSTTLSPDVSGMHQVWSIPWLLDTRLINYRCDLLSKAGVPEKSAFAGPDALLDTLKRLQASGIKYPMLLATGANSLHILASFIWGRGGDFRSPDLRKIALLEPEARQGLLDYFRLHQFIDPKFALKGYNETDPVYQAGEASVLLSGQWVLQTLKHGQTDHPEVVENTRYAPPPGIPYIGGTHIVIWRHSIHDNETLQLIQYLTSPEVYGALTQGVSIIPARKEILNTAPFVNDLDYQMVSKLIQNGRGFNAGNMWAGVEMRLTAFCEQLWQDLFRNPDLNLEVEIERRVRELAARLERTLLSS